MAATNTVKNLEVCQISPWQTSSNPASDFSLSITTFDIFLLSLPPIHRLFFYSLTDSDIPFHDSILPKLKHSLSLTLQHFLPLAGNLILPQDSSRPIILYKPGDAVSFTVAETDADFNHLSSHNPREIEVSCSLLPNIQPSDTLVPAMAIQVTCFPNNIGFSIGTAFSHGIVDGKSETLFTKSWAFLCNLLYQPMPMPMSKSFASVGTALPPELTPLFHRSVIVNALELNFSTKSLKFSTNYSAISNYLQATFELSESDIKKLKKRVTDNNEAWSSKEFHLSTFVVTCAYVLVCLAKAQKVGAEEKLIFSIPADIRGRTEPPIPTNYFGNCVCGRYVFVEAREATEDEDGFVKIAHKISDEIQGLNKEKNLKSVMGIFISKSLERLRSGAKFKAAASSPKFKVYERDFGWGNPKHVEWVLLGEGTETFSLTDAKDGGQGVEVAILLPPEQMLIFASLFSSGLKL